MIWTYIYDFLIQYIYGGVTSNGQSYYAYLTALYSGGTVIDYTGTSSPMLSFPFADSVSMPFGNYLALITTIIIMALIVWFAIWLVIWVFKLVSHAFLLK